MGVEGCDGGDAGGMCHGTHQDDKELFSLREGWGGLKPSIPDEYSGLCY